MHPSPPPSDRSRETGSLVTRVGTVAGAATVAAMACSVPAAMRVARALAGTESPARVWVALGAVALPPMILAVLVLTRAREGWRAFRGPGATGFVYGVSMWLVLLVIVLSLFGSVLRATTHHHALAGVTFALGGLAAAMATAALCARLVAVLRSAGPTVRRVAAVGLSGALALGVAVLALGAARASSHDVASAAQLGTVVDDLAFLLSAALAARQARVVRRILAVVGPPVAVVILAVGVPALRAAPLRQAVAERAPAFAAIGGWLGAER